MRAPRLRRLCRACSHVTAWRRVVGAGCGAWGVGCGVRGKAWRQAADGGSFMGLSEA